VALADEYGLDRSMHGVQEGNVLRVVGENFSPGDFRRFYSIAGFPGELRR
jgi:hypothetical protein